MASVPGCRADVFLSYTSRDNQTASGDGWVTAFQTRLGIALSQELGEDAVIFRDGRSDGAEMLTPEVEFQLRHAATFIPILSPSYHRSAWWQLELQGFQEWVRQRESLRTGGRSRVIKVVRKPLEADVHKLGVLPDAPCYDFFQRDAASHFTYDVPLDSEPYTLLISRLAQEIKAVLVALSRDRTVYLGVAQPGLEEQRRKLERELVDREYRVLSADPAAPAPVPEAQLRESLAACGLSVHFAAPYGTSPPAARGETGLHQSEMRLAAELDVQRVVSAQETGSPEGSPQDLARLLDGDARPDRVDLLMNKTTQTLKETVLERLKGSAVPVPQTGPRVVYLICDRRDHPWLVENDARRVQGHLNALGLEVKVPLGDDAKPDEFSRDNRRKLKECDAVLIYWGDATQGWFDERLSELKQAQGWRRARRFDAKWAYLSNPPNPVKINYATLETDGLVRAFSHFAPELLEPFVQTVRGRAAK